MTDFELATGAADFKDRKPGLVVFGVLEILLGAFFALMIPLIILSMVVSANLSKGAAQPMGPSPGMLILGLLVYVALAVWFVWLGIGSIMARRWARALWLVLSWMWLVCGVTGLVFAVVWLPGMYDRMGSGGQMPMQMVAVMKYVMIGFMTIFYAIVPGALVLFYGSRHVKATCERRDVKVRWTDKCPLPVLAVSVASVLWACCMPMAGFYGWTMPFFGAILSGAAGAAVALVSALLLAYVAWGSYRLNIHAWWCAMLLILAWGISSGVTFSRVSLMEFYERMDFPAAQLEMMKQVGMPPTSWMLVFFGAWGIVVLGYLLYVRRYFTASAAGST